jgi:exopolyphosphatase / guanosine-5'-triphosphate,3'-diphosphate pyrophosphatase
MSARWEWRAFGARLAPAERRLAARAPEREQAGDEIYLVSRAGDASVKLRDGLVDVKALLHVAEDGLEQWRPVLKAGLPLDAADVRFVLAALGTSAPLARDAYTLEELAREVIEPHPGLLALHVHKRRTRYTLAGCLAEATELATPAGTARTVAVEAEDPEHVRAAVRELGVAGLPVVCMARGLKALAGFGGHRYAALDVGTNSVKLHVGERAADGSWSDVLERAEITRLGDGLERTGRLAVPAVERTVTAIAGLAAEARRSGAEAIVAVGTAGLRRAANADTLLELAQGSCGVEVEILSGEEEARLAYRAAAGTRRSAQGSLVVFDTGGGSSQFTFGRDDRVSERFSVDVGSVGLTGRFGLDGVTSTETLAQVRAVVAGALGRLRGRPPPDALVGLGGAVTNLVAVQHALVPYDPEVVRGATLARGEVERQIELYRSVDADERRRVPGLQPQRAETILAGACIVRAVLGLLARDALEASDRGLRHGLLAARFPVPPPSPTGRTASLPTHPRAPLPSEQAARRLVGPNPKGGAS